MSFAHPWVLLLLILPAVIALWELLRSGGRVHLPLDHTTRRPRPVLGTLLKFASVLPALVLALAIVILAGPQVLGPPKEQRQLTNIEIVLDVSGSMTAPFPSGKPDSNRYTAAMAAIEKFADTRKGDAAGLTIFGNEVLRWLPLTKDLNAIKAATPFVDPRKVPPELGGTAVARAVRYAQKQLLTQESGDRLMIVVTDGESPDLGGGEAGRLGRELAGDKITLFTINVGGAQAPPEMFELTQPTGGQVSSATDAGALQGVFSYINSMKPAKVTLGTPEPITYVTPFAIAAGFLLCTHLVLLFGIRYTPW